jgi:hypothetical protein
VKGPVVFIANSKGDNALAASLSDELQKVGLSPLLAPEFKAGAPVERQLESAIRKADWALVILGPDGVTPNVMFELGAAVGRGVPTMILATSEATRQSLPESLKSLTTFVTGERLGEVATRVAAILRVLPSRKGKRTPLGRYLSSLLEARELAPSLITSAAGLSEVRLRRILDGATPSAASVARLLLAFSDLGKPLDAHEMQEFLLRLSETPPKLRRRR